MTQIERDNAYKSFNERLFDINSLYMLYVNNAKLETARKLCKLEAKFANVIQCINCELQKCEQILCELSAIRFEDKTRQQLIEQARKIANVKRLKKRKEHARNIYFSMKSNIVYDERQLLNDLEKEMISAKKDARDILKEALV